MFELEAYVSVAVCCASKSMGDQTIFAVTLVYTRHHAERYERIELYHVAADIYIVFIIC